MPEHTKWGGPGVGADRVVRQGQLSGQRAPAIADHGPLTEVAVNTMRLGVREREQGGVASVLGPHCTEGWATNIATTGGQDAYFRERDDDKKNYCFHINKIILPDFSQRYL